MDYEHINEDLLQEFPELSPAYRELSTGWQDDKPGQYILFEDVFARYIEHLFAVPTGGIREEKLKAIFNFIERMLENGGEVENLGFIAMLEDRSDPWLHASKPYLGPRAEAALDQYDSEWRIRISKDHSLFVVESRDRYGIKEIVGTVLSGAT